MSRCIALLTDFGSADWFVASMKGVILSINPSAAIVDITHEISAGDIQSASFCLLSCIKTFPRETVFVVVVDPGVGSERAAIAVAAEEYSFVGPDNGVLSATVENLENIKIRSIENPRFMRIPVSSTFHGRDIFAPTAAHMSLGARFEDLGPVRGEMVRFAMPVAEKKGDAILGSIVYVDRFGNLITNIPPSIVSFRASRLRIKGHSIPVCSCYADVAEGQFVAVAGSSGFMEISVNKGNAADKLGLKVGDAIEIG